MSDPLISVTIDHKEIIKRLKSQDISVLLGIVIVFTVLVISVVLIFVVDEAKSTMMIGAFGFLVAFVMLILFYVQDVKSRKHIENNMANLQNMSYSGVDKLNCPVYGKSSVSLGIPIFDKWECGDNLYDLKRRYNVCYTWIR